VGRTDAFFILSLWRPARERIVDPEYEVRHSGIAVRAAERWNCATYSRPRFEAGDARKASGGAHGATEPALPAGVRS